MKTITSTALAFAALAIATVATISSSSVSGALAGAEGFSQPSIPIGQITANAQTPAPSAKAF